MIGKDKILRFDVSGDETYDMDSEEQFDHLYGVFDDLDRFNLPVGLLEYVMQTLSQQIHNKKC